MNSTYVIIDTPITLLCPQTVEETFQCRIVCEVFPDAGTVYLDEFTATSTNGNLIEDAVLIHRIRREIVDYITRNHDSILNRAS